MIYARVVASLLEARAWGEGNRKFRFDQAQKTFVPF